MLPPTIFVIHNPASSLSRTNLIFLPLQLISRQTSKSRPHANFRTSKQTSGLGSHIFLCITSTAVGTLHYRCVKAARVHKSCQSTSSLLLYTHSKWLNLTSQQMSLFFLRLVKLSGLSYAETFVQALTAV